MRFIFFKYRMNFNVSELNRCMKCVNEAMAPIIHCDPSNMYLNRNGQVISQHNRDTSWNFNHFIATLHKELKSWRRVYWRLWGNVHYLWVSNFTLKYSFDVLFCIHFQILCNMWKSFSFVSSKPFAIRISHKYDDIFFCRWIGAYIIRNKLNFLGQSLKLECQDRPDDTLAADNKHSVMKHCPDQW